MSLMGTGRAGRHLVREWFEVVGQTQCRAAHPQGSLALKGWKCQAWRRARHPGSKDQRGPARLIPIGVLASVPHQSRVFLKGPGAPFPLSVSPQSWAQWLEQSVCLGRNKDAALPNKAGFVPSQVSVPNLDVPSGVSKNIWSKFQHGWI